MMTGIVLNLDTVGLTDEQFYRLCTTNRDWRFERNAKGELIIMPPVGGVSGNREADLITEVNIWNRKTKLGKVFSSSTIFRLPNGGDRSPDVAWVKLEKWESLTEEEQEKFPPICPDFVIELRSRTDSLKSLQEKMQEYINSGLSLGWLINPEGALASDEETSSAVAPQDEEVEIYRPDRSVEIIKFPVSLSGENILPGFSLNLPII